MTVEQNMYISSRSTEQLKSQAEALKMPYKEIGIMGGMGPAATIDLFKGVVDETRNYITIESDQDHLEIFIANIPQVPDRTNFVLYDMKLRPDSAEDPFPYLVRGINKLAAAGSKFAGIPCNTAHYFVPELQKYIDESGFDMQIINMIEETADEVAKNFDKGAKVGILATTGTLQSGLYHTALKKKGFEVVIPNDEEQEDEVMEAIYGTHTKVGIKLGSPIEVPRERLLRATESLRHQGAEIVLTACTEIPLAFRQTDTDMRLINPTSVLGNKLIELAVSPKLAK